MLGRGKGLEHGRIRTEAARLIGKGQAGKSIQCQEFELERWGASEGG